MSDRRKTTIEKGGVSIKNCWGCQMLMVEYTLTDIEPRENTKNTYIVKCEVRGLETAEVFLEPSEVELVAEINSDGDKITNENTLTEDGVKELFEENFVYSK